MKCKTTGYTKPQVCTGGFWIVNTIWKKGNFLVYCTKTFPLENNRDYREYETSQNTFSVKVKFVR